MPSKASQQRLQIAQQIAAECPQDLFIEIALMGSAARGIAHEQSDLDMLAWVEAIPTLEKRRNFLLAMGIEQLAEEEQIRPDGSHWLGGMFQGIDFEMGWQSLAAVESSLRPLLEASTTEHRQLRLGELFVSAIPLRGEGVLAKWQEKLKAYPVALAARLIEEGLENYLKTGDISRESLLRLLFALNHSWEISWKWAHSVELAFKPEGFFARLEDGKEWECLFVEILALLPEENQLREDCLRKLNS